VSKQIKISQQMAFDLLDCASAAAQLHKEFLMHQNWDEDMSKAKIEQVERHQQFYKDCAAKLKKIIKEQDK